MKFKISVSDLQYAMRHVRDVAPSTGPSAETCGVLLEAKGNRAVFTSSNAEMIAKATVKISPKEDGATVVNAAALYSATSRFQPLKDGVGTEDISVSLSKSSRRLNTTTKTIYKSGGVVPHQRAFSVYNTDFFPATPPSNIKETFKIPAADLMDGIERVAYAVSTDKARVLYTGILLRLEKNQLTVVATNGICLAEYKTQIPYDGSLLEIVIPNSFATKVAKSFFDEDLLEIELTDKMFFVKTPNLTLGGALINEPYPDYKTALPTPEATATVDKYILLDNLLNLNYDASVVEQSRMTASFEDGQVSLTCGNSSNGELVTDFKGKYQFECNLRLLSLSVKDIEGEKVKIGFSGPSKIVIFTSDEPSQGRLLTALVPLAPE